MKTKGWRVGATATMLLLWGTAGALAAGGPYAVEDAAILDRGACHVEAWNGRASTRDRTTVLAPACHIAPNLELTLEGAATRHDAERGREAAVSGKTVLRPVGPGQIGIGLAGGASYDLRGNRPAGLFAVLPISVEPAAGIRLRLNAGWAWDRAERDHAFTWGAAIERALHPRLSAIGEVFGEDRGRAGLQVGLRPWLLEDRVHLDLVYGRNIEGARANWFTIGATVAF